MKNLNSNDPVPNSLTELKEQIEQGKLSKEEIVQALDLSNSLNKENSTNSASSAKVDSQLDKNTIGEKIKRSLNKIVHIIRLALPYIIIGTLLTVELAGLETNFDIDTHHNLDKKISIAVIFASIVIFMLVAYIVKLNKKQNNFSKGLVNASIIASLYLFAMGVRRIINYAEIPNAHGAYLEDILVIMLSIIFGILIYLITKTKIAIMFSVALTAFIFYIPILWLLSSTIYEAQHTLVGIVIELACLALIIPISKLYETISNGKLKFTNKTLETTMFVCLFIILFISLKGADPLAAPIILLINIALSTVGAVYSYKKLRLDLFYMSSILTVVFIEYFSISYLYVFGPWVALIVLIASIQVLPKIASNIKSKNSALTA